MPLPAVAVVGSLAGMWAARRLQEGDVGKSAAGGMLVSLRGVCLSRNFPSYFAFICPCQMLILLFDARGWCLMAVDVFRKGDKSVIYGYRNSKTWLAKGLPTDEKNWMDNFVTWLIFVTVYRHSFSFSYASSPFLLSSSWLLERVSRY